MRALILTLCGFLPFPILMMLRACGVLDAWSQDVTDQLAWCVLSFYAGLLLMLIGAVLAIVGICRKRQRRQNIAALVLLFIWPAVCMVLQFINFG